MVEKFKIIRLTKNILTVELFESLRRNFTVSDTNPDWSFDYTNNFISSDKNVFIIAILDNEVVAYLYGNMLDRLDVKKEFLIYELSTNVKYRKMGIMKRIIESLKEILVKQNFTEAWVLTDTTNQAAMNLYKSTGANIDKGNTSMFVYNLK